jgi:hypothetical protein
MSMRATSMTNGSMELRAAISHCVARACGSFGSSVSLRSPT